MSVADKSMTRTKAFPAANASNQTDPVDLKALTVGPIGSRMQVHVRSPALPALVEDKVVSYELQDSADGTTFAPLLGLPAASVTGAAGNGAGAKTFRFYLPPDCRRYVRVRASVEADGGNNTAASYTVEFRLGA